MAAPVGTAQVPVGTFRGQAGAIPVASVTTILPFSFDTLLTGDYAVAVTAPATAQSRVLVCGDLGGIARLSPPETSVGLSPEEDSGWAGIAYLTPSSGEPASTVLTIFISPVLADAPAG